MKLLFLLTYFFNPFHTNSQSDTTFYISARGNDSNDGLSVNTPLKTIKKVGGGNTYLLKKGDTLYFPIYATTTDQAKPITISSYGEGPKPVLTLYKNIKPAAWQQAAPNVWKVDLKDKTSYSGFMNANDTNVGFIKINNTLYGNKLQDMNSLATLGDFYSDNRFLYIYSAKAPAQQTSPIQVTTNNVVITLSSNMDISNLTIEGTGGHAIRGVKVNNVNLSNIDISDIGGSYLQGVAKKTQRYGNGIEFWQGATNCSVKNCSVKNVYDVAYTMQGDDKSIDFTNVTFSGNVATNNEQSFEIWVSGNKSGFVNCSFVSNKCYNAGYGWSHAVRPDKDFGVHVLNYIWEVDKSGLTIAKNIFRNAKSGYMFSNNFDKNFKFFHSYDNDITLDPGTQLVSRKRNLSMKTSNKFRSVYHLENGSKLRSANAVSQ